MSAIRNKKRSDVRNDNQRMVMKFALVTLGLVLFIGCDRGGDVPKSPRPVEWSPEIGFFNNCQEIDNYLSSYEPIIRPVDMIDIPVAGGESPQLHYQNQVAGVSESDLLQTSPNYYYFVRPGAIEVIERSTLENKKTISVDPSFYRHEITYQNQKLISVASNGWQTRVQIFNEQQQWQLELEQNFDGSYLEYRVVDQMIILAVQTYKRKGQTLSHCEQIYRPNLLDGSSALTYIHQINFAPESRSTQSVGVLGDSDFFYMTQDELILFRNIYGTLSDGTADIKSYFRTISWSNKGPQLNQTVHLNGRLKDRQSVYKSGSNLFITLGVGNWNFDEKFNQMYAFSTSVESVSGASPQYRKVGESEKFGIGEDLKSILYRGDYAYVVTFVNTDPLFVINISDPEKIEIHSELQVPGFSTQLRALNDSTLLGFGFNTTFGNGVTWTVGLKLSLFDITDPLHPMEASSEAFGNRESSSVATSNPKAFYLSSQSARVAFPVALYSGAGNATSWNPDWNLEFAGAMIWEVNENKLIEKGRISHLDWYQSSCKVPTDSQGGCFPLPSPWVLGASYRNIQRILEDNGAFVTFSSLGVRRNHGETLELMQETPFTLNGNECNNYSYGSYY